jgi:hypothetical protein
MMQTALLTIQKPGKMTDRQRKDIAQWLERLSKHLLKEGKNYTEGRFTARFNHY